MEIVKEIKITPVYIGAGEFKCDFSITNMNPVTKDVYEKEYKFMGVSKEWIKTYVKFIMDSFNDFMKKGVIK